MAFLKPKFKFGTSAGSHHASMDEAEQRRIHELGRLYTSTRAGKHFQKDIVKGVENFVGVGLKQLEVSTKLAEDCKKYGADGPSVKAKLSHATVKYGVAKSQMEKERDNLHRALCTLVVEPLKATTNGSSLKDARLLKQKYDRLRQDADSQAVEVSKRKAKEGSIPELQVGKVQAAEQKLDEIAAAMDTMGMNALAAMSLVESQQQKTSLQKILAMVEYERAYFQRVTGILDQLHHDIETQANAGTLLPPPTTPPQATPTTLATTGKPDSMAPPLKFNLAPIEDTEENGENLSSDDDNQSLLQTRNQSLLQENNFSLKNRKNSRNHSLLQESNFNLESRKNSRNQSLLQENNINLESRKNSSCEERELKEAAPVEGSQSFLATATHDFEGEDVGELTISIGDEVCVRQDSASGWSEGLCKGQAGWFPSTYVKKQAGRAGGGARAGRNR